MTRRACSAALLLAFVACSGDDDDGTAPGVDAAPPGDLREVTAMLTVESSGFSEELSFDVPANTRSMTVVVTGANGALYALGSLRTADGTEHVGIDLGTPPGPAMRTSYEDEQIGHMEGGLYQSIRLGTFTQVYPYRDDQALPAGTTTLRVASDMAGPVTVLVLMPEDDGSAVLHINLIAVSESTGIPDPIGYMDELQTIFDQVGVTVVVDDVIMLPGTGLSSISDFVEPQETPVTMSAMLPALVANTVSAKALDVFVVDGLPPGVGGLSLGTPGPPKRGGYYYGILVRQTDVDSQMARVIAHEAMHFMALQHVQNTGTSGTVYPDPLDDTQPGQGNLMESGTTVTADQAFSISRSALLQPE
jgi:hypothetical protein